ncbi:unnamed protein product [Sphagnum jensenii]|uniref:BFD-like [2Fe-2S]-binding domain-containing protein n=1 Tax=Sphagnum jensenii TaxID=128206 RepID=A0ABP0VC40_9BRYO
METRGRNHLGVNRRGESLGSGRITAVTTVSENAPCLLAIDVPHHLLWEARGIKRPQALLFSPGTPLPSLVSIVAYVNSKSTVKLNWLAKPALRLISKIELPESATGTNPTGTSQAGIPPYLCPCLEITRESILERIALGKLQSPEAVLAITHVGEGSCHGQKCMEAFRNVLETAGLDMSNWIDWRFPWTGWDWKP